MLTKLEEPWCGGVRLGGRAYKGDVSLSGVCRVEADGEIEDRGAEVRPPLGHAQLRRSPTCRHTRLHYSFPFLFPSPARVTSTSRLLGFGAVPLITDYLARRRPLPASRAHSQSPSGKPVGLQPEGRGSTLQLTLLLLSLVAFSLSRRQSS